MSSQDSHNYNIASTHTHPPKKTPKKKKTKKNPHCSLIEFFCLISGVPIFQFDWSTMTGHVPAHMPPVITAHYGPCQSRADHLGNYMGKLRVVMMPTLSSLVALEVVITVITTTSNATSDDKVGIMTTLSCQYMQSRSSFLSRE